MKKCNKCNKLKNMICFNFQKNSPDGRAYSCKICKSNNDKKYYEKNKTTLNKKSSNWYQQNKIKYLQRMREYYKKNKDKIRQKNQNYWNNNKEIIADKRAETKLIDKKISSMYQNPAVIGISFTEFKKKILLEGLK